MNYLILLQVGILLILIGFALIFISSFLGARNSAENKENGIKFSVFGLIGPIPFGVANDKKLFYFTIVVAIIFILLFFVLNRKILI